MRRVVFNQKGGVGKSSIVVNLAAVSAFRGKRTLVIDLDAQANASQYLLGKDYSPEGKGVANFFEQFLSFKLMMDYPEDFIIRTPFEHLDLMPATPLLRELHNRLEAKHKIYKLRDAMKRLTSKYDAIYFDTPPAFDFYALSALIASQRCLVPFDCDQFARQALYRLMENVTEIKADHNEELEIEGIVANQFQPGANLPARVIQELINEKLPVLQTRLPASIKMRESHEMAKPLIHSFPKHKLATGFVALYDELSH